jgi:hypothetical protein
MMANSGDNWVYVRVWDRIGLAHYLKVHRSTFATRSKATFHSTGALWTAMLEKAMTAFQKRGPEGLKLDPDLASDQNLAGGSNANAFHALLGVDTGAFPIAPAMQ